jgi:hypothetical protein
MVIHLVFAPKADFKKGMNNHPHHNTTTTMAVRRIRVYLALTIALLSIFSSLILIRKVNDDESLLIAKEAGWKPELTEADTVSTATINHYSRTTSTVESSQPPSNSSRTTVLVNLDGEITKLNETQHPLDRIKVPFPIFHASLPKSGTTTTARYFNCGKIWTAHTFCNTNGTTHHPRKQMRVGHCFLQNMQAGRPPFYDCGRYKVWSDAGHPRGTPCFYPSVHGLDAFYEAYPEATILLVTRNSSAWSQSVLRWKQGDLLKKWRRCEHFPNPRSGQADLEHFYEWHAQNIRNFVVAHPSLSYVEVALEDKQIGEKLEEKIGIPASCFGHHNSHEKRLKLNPRFRQEFLEAQKKMNETKN